MNDKLVYKFPLSLLLLLMALAAIAPLTTDMYLPAFALITQDLGLSAGQVELSFATFFIGMLSGMLVYGPISDVTGRKRPLVFGLVLYTLSSIVIAQINSFDAMLVMRFLQGFGGCAGAVVGIAIIRDRCDHRESAQIMSMIMLVMGAAPIIAPLLGGMILEVGHWRTIFAVLTGFGLLCLLYCLFMFEDTAIRKPEFRVLDVVKGYAELLTTRRFMIFVLAQAFMMGGMFTYIVGSPFILMEVHGVSSEHFGLFFGANALGVVGTSQINRRLLGKYSNRPVTTS